MPRLRNASWSSSNVRGPVVGSMAAMACRMPQARCPSSTLLAMAWDRVGRAAQAAYVASVAGLVALVTIALFFSIGQPWGTLNDIALLVMTLAIAPMMLGSYELGGVTPLWPARLSLAGGIGGGVVWSALPGAMIVGAGTGGYNKPPPGAPARAAGEEGRPACARLELRAGVKRGRMAHDAAIGPIAVVVPIPAAEGPLGLGFLGHGVLDRAELGQPCGEIRLRGHQEGGVIV